MSFRFVPESETDGKMINEMKKIPIKFLFVFIMVIGLAITGFGQSKKHRKKEIPKRNVPKIVVPKREKSPKENKDKKKNKKPKPNFYSEFIISKKHFETA